MDAKEYNKGHGKIKLRVKFDIVDPKSIVIREICYGTTTESLIRSIDEAAKRGKIKIDAIHDYTADQVAIEIKLTRGHYAEELIDSLYVYTDCEVTVNPQMVMIKDNLPWEGNVHEILEFNVQSLQALLKLELEIERERLEEQIFEKSLERIFIENRLYKPIESLTTYEQIHASIENGLKPFCENLLRQPNEEDREHLLSIPIRRISLFDLDKNRNDVLANEKLLGKTLKSLKDIKKVAINYLQDLIEKYGKDYPRRTQIQTLESVDVRAVTTKTIKVGFDPSSGFVGTKVAGPQYFECTNFDKILLLYTNGTYQVINIPEKQYVHHQGQKVCFVGVADKKTVINIASKDPKTHLCYAKRFIVEKFILDKMYSFMDPGMELLFITTDLNPILEMIFIPKLKQKISQANYYFEQLSVKNVSSKAVKMATREIKKLLLKKG